MEIHGLKVWEPYGTTGLYFYLLHQVTQLFWWALRSKLLFKIMFIHQCMLSINLFFWLCLIPLDFLTSVLYWKKKHFHLKDKKKGYHCFQREEGGDIEFVACCSLRPLYCVSGSQRVPLPDQLLWFADHVVPVFQLSAPRIHERPNDHNAQQHCQ